MPRANPADHNCNVLILQARQKGIGSVGKNSKRGKSHVFKTQVARFVICFALIAGSFSAGGCEQAFRQAFAPSFFDGLALITDGVVAGLEAQFNPQGSSSSTGS
jgi:hypothetical protein